MNPAPPAPYLRYVDTPAGQLHVAECGAGGPLVLLPWFPLSARLYDPEIPRWSADGWRTLAVDPLGFGRSGPRPPRFRVEQHADAIESALATLGVREPVLLGGHFGAQVALELASRAAVGARALVLDGGPLVAPDAVAAIRARLAQFPAPGWQADGSHRTFLHDHAVATYRIFDPGFEPDAARLPLVHRFVGDYLAAGMPVANDTPHDYPFAERLRALQLPVVVLSAERDPLVSAHAPLLACARRGHGHVFAGSHPLHDPARAGEYAGATTAALAALGVRTPA